MLLKEIEFTEQVYDIFAKYKRMSNYSCDFNTLRQYAIDNNIKKHRSEERFIKFWSEKHELNRVVKLFKNFPIENQFIGDFVDLNRMIVIEIDGSFHDSEIIKKKDLNRDKKLKKAGWYIIRLKTTESNDKWSEKIEAHFKKALVRNLDKHTAKKQKQLLAYVKNVSARNSDHANQGGQNDHMVIQKRILALE